MAGTSAAQIPDAPALLPWLKGGISSSLGRAAKLLWWVIIAVPRLLVPAIETVWEGEGGGGGRGGGVMEG